MNILDLVTQGDAVTKLVAVGLLAMSVASWVVILWKAWMLRRAATDVGRATAADGEVLALAVSDDGRGGADPSRGTGLAGLQQRVAAVDGQLYVTSPPGGPTTLQAVLPLRPGRSQ